MPILVQKENEQEQPHIFQNTYFKSFQIHQLAKLYRFEHTNHGIYVNFVFQNIYKLFSHACNLPQ